METLTEAELCFPDLFNTSCRRPQRLVSQVMLLSIIICCISVLTVALNLLVVISISHYRQLHTTTNLILLSLGVTDLSTGLNLPVAFFLFNSCWTLRSPVCSLVLLPLFSCFLSSVGNMVLISVDRYVAICEPLLYHTKVTVRRVRISVILCWAFSVSYSGVFFAVSIGERDMSNSCIVECILSVSHALGTFDLIMFFVCPVTVIIVLYSRVFVVAVSQARAMHSRTVASVNVSVKRSELKAARTLGVVILVFLLCFCPSYAFSITGQNTIPGAMWFVYLNSCFNPLIYVFFYPWFRKAVKLVVTLQILQTDSCKAKIL